jgi:hypothetical protein
MPSLSYSEIETLKDAAKALRCMAKATTRYSAEGSFIAGNGWKEERLRSLAETLESVATYQETCRQMEEG